MGTLSFFDTEVNLNEVPPIELKSWASITNPDINASDKEFVIRWSNIKYVVYQSKVDRFIRYLARDNSVPNERQILKGVNGSLKCGDVTAILGPSGAGKTCLIECLIGRRMVGVTGQIKVSNFSRVKLSFIPQKDYLFTVMTVREAMILSSKLENPKIEAETVRDVPDVDVNGSTHPQNSVEDMFHTKLVHGILKDLGLLVCIDTRISSLSGGQLKRLSIALELVANPNFLVLDEPTSGLDSSSSAIVIDLLKTLAKSSPKMAILLTIHQPSYKLLSSFDKLIVLSNQNGNCIFEGPPNEIMMTCEYFGHPVPIHDNPSDFIMEIASGDHGQEIVKKMSRQHDQMYDSQVINRKSFEIEENLLELIRDPTEHPILAHLWLLFLRSFLVTLRDPWLINLRLFSHILAALMIGALFDDSGRAAGCPRSLYDDHEHRYYKSIVGTSFDEEFFEDLSVSLKQEKKVTYYNSGCLIFSTMFLMFTGMMPTVLTFPAEIDILMKEKFNHRYSSDVYFVSKMFADVPFQLFFPPIYICIHYFINHEPSDEIWRFFTYTAILILMTMVAQSHGLLISVALASSPNAAVYLAPVSMIPLLLFCGFFIRYDDLSDVFKGLSYMSYMKFALESVIISIYGYDRCGYNVTGVYNEIESSFRSWVSITLLDSSDQADENNDKQRMVTNFSSGIMNHLLGDYRSTEGEIRSLPMNEYDLEDDDMGLVLSLLFVHLVVLRLLAWIVLRMQLRGSH